MCIHSRFSTEAELIGPLLMPLAVRAIRRGCIIHNILFMCLQDAPMILTDGGSFVWRNGDTYVMAWHTADQLAHHPPMPSGVTAPKTLGASPPRGPSRHSQVLPTLLLVPVPACAVQARLVAAWHDEASQHEPACRDNRARWLSQCARAVALLCT